MLNKAQIIGNLGADPKIANGKTSGIKIASFSVATTERGYTKQDGTKTEDRTDWHNVVCFGKLAEIVEKYVVKGSKVYVEGKMRTRSYEDNSGAKRYVMEINAEVIEMLGDKPSKQTQNQTQTYSQTAMRQPEVAATQPYPHAVEAHYEANDVDPLPF